MVPILLFLALLPAASGEGWLERLSETVADWMNVFGGPGVGAAIAIENLFPPIPSEVVLPLAGFTAAQPGAKFTAFEAILWATAGSVTGAIALYWIGRTLGHDRMVRIFERLPLTDGDDVDRTVSWFAKHGGKAVFFGRMLPLFRSLISIPAGIERMPQMKFIALTAAGSAIWNTLFILAGYSLGEQWETVLTYSDIAERVIIVIVLALLVWWVVSKLRKRRRSLDRSVRDNHPSSP